MVFNLRVRKKRLSLIISLISITIIELILILYELIRSLGMSNDILTNDGSLGEVRMMNNNIRYTLNSIYFIIAIVTIILIFIKLIAFRHIHVKFK